MKNSLTVNRRLKWSKCPLRGVTFFERSIHFRLPEGQYSVNVYQNDVKILFIELFDLDIVNDWFW